MALLLPSSVCAKSASDSLLLQRVLSYRQYVPVTEDTIKTNIYIRYYIKTERRNFTLMAIPSMFYISRGRREYAGETYTGVAMADNKITSAIQHVNTGTIPRHRDAMETIEKYLMPDVYGVTMFDNQVLSPFNRNNMRLYRYSITTLTDNRTEITFAPKRRNTQLISGSAVVDSGTGRIIRIKFHGEYDMLDFNVDATMGKNGMMSLMPKTCDIDAKFHFIGNKLYFWSNNNLHGCLRRPHNPCNSCRFNFLLIYFCIIINF